MLRWNEADLEVRLCRALDIARKTINYFAIDGFTAKESPEYGFGPEKPIAASASGHRPKVASRVPELAELLAPHARSERVLADIALHPALAFKFAVPHILLTRLGYRDASFDDFLRSCTSSQVRNGHDRPPSASIERRWISSLWTGQDVGAGWRADLLNSVLNWPLDILGGLHDDAYAFTHLIMYCTDFGFQNRRLPRRRSAILGEAGSLLAKCVDAEDYDLAAEVILAWPLTGAAWSPSAAFGFRIVPRWFHFVSARRHPFISSRCPHFVSAKRRPSRRGGARGRARGPLHGGSDRPDHRPGEAGPGHRDRPRRQRGEARGLARDPRRPGNLTPGDPGAARALVVHSRRRPIADSAHDARSRGCQRRADARGLSSLQWFRPAGRDPEDHDPHARRQRNGRPPHATELRAVARADDAERGGAADPERGTRDHGRAFRRRLGRHGRYAHCCTRSS